MAKKKEVKEVVSIAPSPGINITMEELEEIMRIAKKNGIPGRIEVSEQYGVSFIPIKPKMNLPRFVRVHKRDDKILLSFGIKNTHSLENLPPIDLLSKTYEFFTPQRQTLSQTAKGVKQLIKAVFPDPEPETDIEDFINDEELLVLGDQRKNGTKKKASARKK